MNLYFSPFASSMACHIMIREADLPIELVPVALPARQLADKTPYETHVPKGLVPALRFDDGELLTECAVILQALAGIAPPGAFMPAFGTREHLRALEWLNFVATEVHKHCLYPLFSPAAPAPAKAWAKEQLLRKLAFVAERLETQPYLAAGRYTVADAYMAWALFLCELGRIGLPDTPGFRAYWQRLRERPAIVAALAHERALLKAAG